MGTHETRVLCRLSTVIKERVTYNTLLLVATTTHTFMASILSILSASLELCTLYYYHGGGFRPPPACISRSLR